MLLWINSSKAKFRIGFEERIKTVSVSQKDSTQRAATKDDCDQS